MVRHWCCQALRRNSFVECGLLEITDRDAEALVYLHGYSTVAITGISLFHFDHKTDHFLGGSASAGRPAIFVGIQGLVLSLH